MPDSSSVLASRYLDELTAAAASGQFLTLEKYFEEHPEACEDPEVAVRLIYEDFCQRQEAGFAIDPDELLERFPQWRSQLEIVLDCHELFERKRRKPQFPDVGEKLGEFLILDELGRGSNGRVFLARQPALSDRPVVVKMTPRQGSEHLSLARLQHSSIVPLYLVQDHEDRNLRLLCMPYLGGIGLDRILKQIASMPFDKRCGRHLADALRKSQANAAVALPWEGPALQFLMRATYTQAVCWIGACLADALQYAHGRGLVHLDVKPSNVLLAGDGQPMLLDFHLAHEMVLASGAKADWIGGTPDYMSPEQQLAMEATVDGEPIPRAIDGRSDIYSLGLVLHELLTGSRPEPVSDGSRDLSALAIIKPQAARVVRKCLSHDPQGRYAHAAELAADLRKCLLHSHGNAARRSRAWVVPLAGTIVTLVCVAAFTSRPLDRDDTPTSPAAQAEAVAASRGRMASELHELVEKLQFVEHDEIPRDQLRDLEDGCRRLWENRTRLIEASRPSRGAPLPEPTRTDLFDLATAWASLHVRLAEGSRDHACRDAIQILNQAAADCGASVVLDCERQTYTQLLATDQSVSGAAKLPANGKPYSPWECLALGRAHLRGGQLESAAQQLQAALDLNPGMFWANFYQGICLSRLRQFDASLAAFSACVALAPSQAECFIHRAAAYRALGRHDLAERDLARARGIDPWRKIE